MRRNRLSLILVIASLALSILAASQVAMPVNAVTNNSHVIASTGDHYVFESSYQTHGFYAQGRYWVFYEDSSVSCEGFAGCFFFTSSTDGVNFASRTQVGVVHVTDSDWSIATNGTHVFYARYPEDTFQTTTNKPLLFGVGRLSPAGTISWSPEQIVRPASSSLEFP
ncbi:MAG TPA: hypothetical protein VFV92_12965, partial [Candidatus Bathyarchaeia archaeon]|nr:hypothetical protein [Candidatus Bathyarchaeia archaeon]